MATTDDRSRAARTARAIASAILVLLAVVCVALGMLTAWLRTQVLDTDQWVRTSRAMIEDRDVRRAVATWSVDQLFERARARDLIASSLPGRSQALADAITERLRIETYSRAERALETPQVQQAWTGANRSAHERLVRAVEGDEPIIVEGPGRIRIDLRPVLERVAERADLDPQLVDRVPDRIATVEPRDPEAVARTLRWLRLLDRWGGVVSLLAVPLLGAGIALAANRRRAWLWTGVLVVAASWLVGRACVQIGPQLADIVGATTTWRAAIRSTWTAVSELLREISRAGVAAGLLVLLAAWTTGRSAPLVRVRRALSPVLVGHRLVVVAAAGVAAWFALEALPAFDVVRAPVRLVLAAGAAGTAWTFCGLARDEQRASRGDAARAAEP